ncbi:MAG: hypothetical protein Crog4KO_08080 [Crocinitomicaceae bacterium]
MKHLFLAAALGACAFSGQAQLTYPIVDTDVEEFYDNSSIISAPAQGQAFYGQDASYNGHQPSYTDNGDGTITDNVTGLMWEKDMGTKISYEAAVTKAQNSTLGGHSDWRIPTIKELVSLTAYTGRCYGDYAGDLFIDDSYFNQPLGDTSIGEREIDGQTWSSTFYVGLTMNGDSSIFGMNFVDGRLKGYPKVDPMTQQSNTLYFRMVRGNTSYGINNFQDNGDGTVSDIATGLMWQKADDGNTYDWENALDYAESLTLAGYSDWRLPNMKELHSIVDYTRSPDVTNSPAIDPVFSCTEITDPEGSTGHYGYYWTGSPLKDGLNPYASSVYVCFGEAQGQMESPPNSGNFQLLDVHGAGSVRNDPKTGNPQDYPQYWGPQGDVQYAFNFVRVVRDMNDASINEQSLIQFEMYPNPANSLVEIVSMEQFSHVRLLSLTGTVILDQNDTGFHTTIDLNELPKGVYLVQIETDSGKVEEKRLVVL